MIETLLRISTPTDYKYNYYPYRDSVYSAKLTEDEEGYDPYYSQWYSAGINRVKRIISSVSVYYGASVAPYSRKETLSECLNDEASFYFDKATQVLYIHYVFDLIPAIGIPSIGLLAGFAKDNTQYIDDIKYPARLQSVLSVKKKVDPLNVGKMSFQDQTVKISNGDGAIDSFLPEPIPGSLSTIVLYDTETQEEVPISTGRVSSDSSTIDATTIKLTDVRRSENVSSPDTVFTVEDFPKAADKVINKTIPDGYGLSYGIPAFPLNEKAGSGNIQFKYAQYSYELQTVWAKIDDEWKEITTALAFDQDTATFYVPSGDIVASGRDTAYEVRVNAILRGSSSLVNVFDIITDLNSRYAGLEYDSSNYNQTEFASECTKLAPISLYMGAKKNLFGWFEKMQTGNIQNFIYDITGDGRRTVRVDDKYRTPKLFINRSKIKNQLLPVTRDFSEYASSVTIKYKEDLKDGATDELVNDTYKEQAIITYGFPNDIEVEGLFAGNETYASIKGNFIAADQSVARPSVDLVLHGDNLSGVDVELFDIINLDTSIPEVLEHEDVDVFYENPAGDTYYEYPGDIVTAAFNEDPASGDIFYENPNGQDIIYYSTGIVPDVFYYHPPGDIVISEYREYLGTINGKVVDINYNPENLDYKLKIREVPN